MDKLTRRDQLAISMPVDAIPGIETKEEIKEISDRFRIEWSDEDMLVQIKTIHLN